MYFKIIYFILLLTPILFYSQEQDIMKDRILKYNNIKKTYESKFIKIDSSKVLTPLDHFKTNYTSKTTTGIIKERPEQKNYLLFITSIIAITCISFLVFAMNKNFSFIFRNFLKINEFEDIEGYNFANSFIITGIYLVISSLLLTGFYKINYPFVDLSSTHLYLIIIIGLLLHIIIKFIINRLLKYTFGWKNIENIDINIWLDFMLVFIVFILPILFFSSISDTKLMLGFYVSMGLSFLLFYIIYISKSFQFYTQYINQNVVASVFYFLTIEIIPLLLLAKYLVNFST